MDDANTATPPMRDATPSHVQFAGFWRRIGAALLDMIILGIAGWIVSMPFYNQLVTLGPYARAIGFPVALLYFGVLNSSIGGGGTLGKKALGIRVVARDGATISAGRSLWRALVFLVPVYLNGLDISFLRLNHLQMTAAEIVQMFLVFGVLFSSIYLYLANWHTRQVMHDLAAGTFVVRTASVDTAIAQRINPVHIVIVALFLLTSAAAVPLAARFAPPGWKSAIGDLAGTQFDELAAIQTAALKDPGVLSASAQDQTTTFITNGQTTRTTGIVVTVIWRGVPQSSELAADAVAQRVLQVSPTIMTRQKLTVVVRYGFDIGIVQNWQSNVTSLSPEEWNVRIKNAHPGNDI